MRYSIRALYDEAHGLRYYAGHRSVPGYYRKKAEDLVQEAVTPALMKKLLNDYDAEQISATVAKWEIENDGDRWIPFKPDILKHPDNVKVERAKPEPHDPEDVPEDAPIREGNRAHMTEKTPQNSGPPSWFDSENIEPCGCDEKYQYREKGVGKHGYSDSYSTYQCFKCNKCGQTWCRSTYME
jgi:hypothetical protein